MFYLDLPVKHLHVFVLCKTCLPIEKRMLGLERNNRKCQVCNLNEIGDEYHYILICRYTCLNNKRRNLLSCFTIFSKIIRLQRYVYKNNAVDSSLELYKNGVK